MNYSSWYEKAFPALSGFGLWLRGGELNTVPAAEFERRHFRVLITRLSTWRDTADSFTHNLLYQIVNRIDNAYPDLAYLPPPKDAPLFDTDNVPWLLGATSKRGARDFSVLALSLSIVQELLNIPVMLQKSGIPLSKKERLRDAACPLVILGGASALYTSVLFNDDPLVDGIFVGEDAATIGKLFQLCKDGGHRGLTKEAIIAELRNVPGFFEPDKERSLSIFQAPVIAAEQFLEAGPVLYAEECIGRANLQISEGCKFSCNFCAESFSRKPYRETGLPALREAARHQKAAMGAHDAELYSFNFSMHRDFYRILKELSALFPSIGLKSQRADSFAADPDLVNYLHAVNKTSITFGLEGISPRLRRRLNKNLDEADLSKSLTVLLSSPLREIKIFLIATGLERQDDFDGFRELLAFMNETMRAARRTPRIIFSMTLLVRFPWTPIEFEDAPAPSVCQGVLRTVERLVRAAGFEFRASSNAADYLISQILARAGDPRVARALRQAQEETGFIYYREISSSFVTAFRKRLERLGVAPEALLAGHKPAERAARPWSGLRTGVSEETLIQQWESAKSHADNAGSAQAARIRAPGGPKKKPYTADKLRAMLKNAIKEEASLAFRVRVGPALAGVPHAMRCVALARAFMLADARVTEGYRGFRPSPLFNGLEQDWVVGDDSCILVWSAEAAAMVKKLMNDAAFIEKVNALLNGWETLVGPGGNGPAAVKAVIFRSPFRFDPSAYCIDKSLKFTLHKSTPGTALYALSKESLKKKIFGACTAEEAPGGGWTVSVTPGPKFLPEEFARTAFRFPSENEWVRIAMTAEFR